MMIYQNQEITYRRWVQRVKETKWRIAKVKKEREENQNDRS